MHHITHTVSITAYTHTHTPTVPHTNLFSLLFLDTLSAYISRSTSLLMLYYEREWVPVCADTITDSEVDVICRELGFDTGQADATPTDYFVYTNSKSNIL